MDLINFQDHKPQSDFILKAEIRALISDEIEEEIKAGTMVRERIWRDEIRILDRGITTSGSSHTDFKPNPNDYSVTY